MKFTLLATVLCVVAPTLAKLKGSNNIFLIRHGEKPSNDSITGLSDRGVQRSKCLPDVFGDDSDFDIGFIMAQTPKADGSQDRPFLTIQPTGEALGLDVDVNCQRDDAKCVKKAVKKFMKKSDQDILICWEHGKLTDIAAELGVKNFTYPGSHFDLIFDVRKGKIISTTSEGCPGLDDNSTIPATY